MASKIFTNPFKSRSCSVSETRGTPSRAVYDDLSDAHASITGRRPPHWASLAPGWAKDQPLIPQPAQSTPLENVARYSGGLDGIDQDSPSINRPLSHRLAPSAGRFAIAESEIGSKFPSIASEGRTIERSIGFDNEHGRQASTAHRRSRSLDMSAVSHMVKDLDKKDVRQDTDVAPNSTVSDIYHMYGESINRIQPQARIGQTAWTPRLSTDETDQEPGQLFAKPARMPQDGPAGTRPVPQTESSGLENHVAMHLRNLSSVSQLSYPADAVVDAGERTSAARLFDPGVAFGVSRSSSSTSFGTFHMRRYGNSVQEAIGTDELHGNHAEKPAVRTGTPPLLFGTNAMALPLVRQDSSFKPAEDSELDWQTVDGMSKNNSHPVHMTGGTGSLADYSSSSGDVRVRGLPNGGEILQHPAHPRYMHTWNMMRDAYTGQTLLLPQDREGAKLFPYQNALTPPAMRRHLFADSQHPSPQSGYETRPLYSSPFSMMTHGGSLGREESKSLLPPRSQMSSASKVEVCQRPYYVVSEQGSVSGEDEALDIISKSQQAQVNTGARSNKKDHSSGWVSTDTSGFPENSVHQHPRAGSFAQMMLTGAKANITGTPEGTGAREVGSSLANTSSPLETFASSPVENSNAGHLVTSNAPKIVHRRTIDGSLDTIKTQSSDELFKLMQATDEANNSIYSHEEDFTALPQATSNLPYEVLEHREQLIKHNLLPRPESPLTKSGSTFHCHLLPPSTKPPRARLLVFICKTFYHQRLSFPHSANALPSVVTRFRIQQLLTLSCKSLIRGKQKCRHAGLADGNASSPMGRTPLRSSKIRSRLPTNITSLRVRTIRSIASPLPSSLWSLKV